MPTLLLLLACHDGTPPTDAPPADTTDTAGPDTADTDETAAPVDADGDGALSDVDCDDADAARFPGAADPCDGVDQDCDGNPVGEGECGELVVVDERTAVGWWEGPGDEGTLAIPYEGAGALGRAADLDGDGITDVTANLRGNLFVHGGIPAPATPVGDDALAWWSGGVSIAGDFDGDGADDLFLVSQGGSYDAGDLYLRRGPTDLWPTTTTSLADTADAQWTLVEQRYTEYLGLYTAAGDVTGDGLSDIVLLSQRSEAASEYDPYGYVRVVAGRTSALPVGAALEDEEPWFGLDDTVGGPELTLLPDLDGDGIDDLTYAAQLWEGSERIDTLTLIPTDVLTPTYSGQMLSDLWDAVPNGDVVQRYRPIQDRTGLGDVNGDGYGDVAVAVYDTLGEVDTYCTSVLHGAADLPARTLSDQIGGRVCDSSTHRDPAGRVVPDTDGDGVPDLFFDYVLDLPYDDAVGWKWRSCVLPTSQLPASGVLAFDDARKFCFGSADTLYRSSDVIDLDADGLPELLVSDTTWNNDAGRILVMAGFTIPWDDATRW